MKLKSKDTQQKQAYFPFIQTFVQLGEPFFVAQKPTQVKDPQVKMLNHSLAIDLGLDFSAFDQSELAAIFSGNLLTDLSNPISMAYAGHQFGYFVPQLGDGRTILLGELLDCNGKVKDIQLKGSGLTPFSRRGDGRATLGSVIREYLMSEAMHGLKIPTTRSLAIVATGEIVARETDLPGAILTRVAASHIRIGTFEYFSYRGDDLSIKKLADYAINRHYSEIMNFDNPYQEFLKKVIETQASLVAHWMGIGFVHGVMNTDNMTISGETIDYGPCAFIDRFDPNIVFSSIDVNGRYAFANQPQIAHWNLARFAETLMPLLHEDPEQALIIANTLVNEFPKRYKFYWLDEMTKKLGLFSIQNKDEELVGDLLKVMHIHEEDFTNTFQLLIQAVNGANIPEHFKEWSLRWKERITIENRSIDEVTKLMENHNPVFIPRNHLVENVIKKAVENHDFIPLNELLKVLSNPYSNNSDFEHYKQPAEKGEKYRTFCGT